MIGLNEQAWERWAAYKRSIRKPYKSAASIELAQKKLAGFGDYQMQVVEQSIEHQWVGLFELPKRDLAKLQAKSAAEQLERRKLRELHERGIQIGFRAPIQGEDSIVYGMMLRRFEDQRWKEKAPPRSIRELLGVK